MEFKYNKNCQFRLCKALFETRNNKKVFCNLSCKNREGYLKKMESGQENRDWIKGYNRNLKFIEMLVEAKKETVSPDTLEQMGFDTKYLKAQTKTNEGVWAYEIGPSFLVRENDMLKIIRKK
jgi:hypothetical protein